MAVNPQNLVLGPCQLYMSLFGAAEPADSAITPNGVTTPPNSSVWTDAGGTSGGVTLGIDGTLTNLTVDQIIMDVGARLTGLAATVATKMAEMSLANLNAALNFIMTIGGGSGYATADLQVGSAATQPLYAALIVDGWAPTLNTGAPARRRAIVRKVLATPKISLNYDKSTQQSNDVSWSAFYVSPSVSPVHIVDQLA